MGMNGETFQLVIEGVGSVVEKYYIPALRRLRGDGILFKVSFGDDKRFWKSDPEKGARMARVLEEINKLGGAYFDKSDPADAGRWEALRPDAVVIATPDRTHVGLALEWLARPVQPTTIYIEKPLDVSINRARDLLEKIGPNNPAVRAFDHYRARLLPTRSQFDMLNGFFRDGIARFTFYFLEDVSGTDPAYATRQGGRQGPIENEGRTDALREGLLLDLMPHVIAVLAHFGVPSTMELVSLRVGKYTGVDGDDTKAAGIEGETFAEARFVFRSHQGHQTEGLAYIGKGVRGIRASESHYNSNAKLLILEGANGRRVNFDFRKSGDKNPSTSVWFDERDREHFRFDLYPEPYYIFLRSIVSPSHFDERIALPVEVGKNTLQVIDDIRHPILRRNGQLAHYPCGVFGRRESLYLDDIVKMLPVIYGRQESLTASTATQKQKWK